MFRLFARKPLRARAPVPTAQLHLEALEGRFNPMAPMISFNAAVVNSGMLVDLTGTVMDENPAGVTITFTGAATGQTTANAAGQYSLRATATGLGMIQAVGKDQENLNSNNATAMISSMAPSLTLSVSYGAQRTVTLTGQVTDEDPGNRLVTFTGKVTGTTTTNSNGTYSYTAEASGLGTVSATVTDIWGQTSSAATVTLANANPTITNFQASSVSQGYWTFEGRVLDQSPAGLTVTLGGLSALSGVTVTTDQDGDFSITVDLEGETGLASAQTTDWWGLSSPLVWTMVF